MITIRDVKPADAQELLDIYNYYVLNTAVTFEITPPTPEEFGQRIATITETHPYIVAEEDGRIVGYSYAHPFVGREAYAHSCETTIYVRNSEHGHGTGRQLYEELEKRLKAQGIINLYACIADPEGEPDEHLSADSPDFHTHMGYVTVGTFRKCGRKFGRWYTMIWMEKIIGDYGDYE